MSTRRGLFSVLLGALVSPVAAKAGADRIFALDFGRPPSAMEIDLRECYRFKYIAMQPFPDECKVSLDGGRILTVLREKVVLGREILEDDL